VTLNATLNGTVIANRLTINGGGALKANEQPPDSTFGRP
jgi:hypothetical protein